MCIHSIMIFSSGEQPFGHEGQLKTKRLRAALCPALRGRARSPMFPLPMLKLQGWFHCKTPLLLSPGERVWGEWVGISSDGGGSPGPCPLSLCLPRWGEQQQRHLAMVPALQDASAAQLLFCGLHCEARCSLIFRVPCEKGDSLESIALATFLVLLVRVHNIGKKYVASKQPVMIPLKMTLNPPFKKCYIKHPLLAVLAIIRRRNMFKYEILTSLKFSWSLVNYEILRKLKPISFYWEFLYVI